MGRPTMEIAGRRIGAGEPPYVVAEISGNHNRELGRALRLVEAAKAAGADAVKLQTYTADTITIDSDRPDFWIEGGLWGGRSLYVLYDAVHMPWDWHEPIFAKARELGITLFSSPFDGTAVDLLEGLDCPAYKIASFEAVDLGLIERVAATRKPVVISTGMANLQEIEEAVAAARGAGCEELALLHCVSAYPTPPEEANLRTLTDLAERFGVVVGLSDHTLGIAVATSAIAFGAAIVEKHFTLSRDDGGPDAAFSLEADEFKDLSASCRAAWAALGRVSYERTPGEAENVVFRRSLYVVEDMAADERFTETNLRSIRPGFGLAPKHLPEVMGRRAARAIARGTPLAWKMVEQ